MAKKKVVKSAKPNKNSFLDSLPKNEEEHLQLLIRHSERAAKEAGSNSLNELFTKQADRLRARLEGLRK